MRFRRMAGDFFSGLPWILQVLLHGLSSQIGLRHSLRALISADARQGIVVTIGTNRAASRVRSG